MLCVVGNGYYGVVTVIVKRFEHSNKRANTE